MTQEIQKNFRKPLINILNQKRDDFASRKQDQNVVGKEQPENKKVIKTFKYHGGRNSMEEGLEDPFEPNTQKVENSSNKKTEQNV